MPVGCMATIFPGLSNYTGANGRLEKRYASGEI
jgi:hypothetical protein